MLISVLFLITIITPVIFWLWFFLSQDQAEPEPRKLLVKIFFLGIGTFLFALAVEGTIFSIVFPTQYQDILQKGLKAVGTFSITTAILFFLAGLIEELLKYFVLWEFAYSKREFNQIADGVFYGVTLALGFSLVENGLYFYQLSSTPIIIFASTSFIRGIATMLLHITTAGYIGYGLGKMKFTVGHNKSIILRFLFLAILLHGLFNVLVLLPRGIIFAFPILFLAFIYLLSILKKPETKLGWKLMSPRDTLNKGS
jgi:RsiW-degrading membrane proteinase PrsW (M82 family)